MNHLIQRSFNEQIPMTMMYQAKNGTISKRTIIVTSISAASFNAYCFNRKQTRCFLFSNVLSILPASLASKKRIS